MHVSDIFAKIKSSKSDAPFPPPYSNTCEPNASCYLLGFATWCLMLQPNQTHGRSTLRATTGPLNLTGEEAITLLTHVANFTELAVATSARQTLWMALMSSPTR